jgi:uncharacterized RDD family membrane protein YckC
VSGYGVPVSEASDPFPGELATLGRRVLALCLDWLVSIGVSLVVLRNVAYGSGESSIWVLVIFVTQVVLLTWLMAASFGQRILGLSVVRTDGTRIGLGRVVLRTLLICLVIPAVVMDDYGRGLHDRAVDSMVVRRN